MADSTENDKVDNEETVAKSVYNSDVEKWKTLSRKHESDWKKVLDENKSLVERVKELEKDSESLASSREEVTNLRRVTAVIKAGLPEDLASLVKGETDDDIAKDVSLLTSISSRSDKKDNNDAPYVKTPSGNSGQKRPSELDEKVRQAISAAIEQKHL